MLSVSTALNKSLCAANLRGTTVPGLSTKGVQHFSTTTRPFAWLGLVVMTLGAALRGQDHRVLRGQLKTPRCYRAERGRGSIQPVHESTCEDRRALRTLERDGTCRRGCCSRSRASLVLPTCRGRVGRPYCYAHGATGVYRITDAIHSWKVYLHGLRRKDRRGRGLSSTGISGGDGVVGC